MIVDTLGVDFRAEYTKSMARNTGLPSARYGSAVRLTGMVEVAKDGYYQFHLDGPWTGRAILFVDGARWDGGYGQKTPLNAGRHHVQGKRRSKNERDREREREIQSKIVLEIWFSLN